MGTWAYRKPEHRDKGFITYASCSEDPEFKSRPSMLSEVFLVNLLPHHTNFRIVFQIILGPLPSASIPFHYSPINLSFDAIF
jgi:hypothetical protein